MYIKVNRLTKELSHLRQQTASVASTASSTSATFNEPLDSLHLLHSPSYATNAGMTHTGPSTRHRSSSSLSSYVPAIQESRTGRDSSAVPTSRVPLDHHHYHYPRPGRSRATSNTSHISDQGSTLTPQLQGDRLSANVAESSPGPHWSMNRADEAAHYRGEVESLKRENDALRQQVKDLDAALRKQKQEEQPSIATAGTAAADTE